MHTTNAMLKDTIKYQIILRYIDNKKRYLVRPVKILRKFIPKYKIEPQYDIFDIVTGTPGTLCGHEIWESCEAAEEEADILNHTNYR